MASKKREKNRRVSEKISRLMREENVPQRQAVAMSLSMERSGRLGRGGKYFRKGSKRRSGGR